MDLIETSAKNWAGWHQSQLSSHGLECSWTDSLWSCLEEGGVIYLAALTLSATPTDEAERMAEIERLVAARNKDDFILVDSWMSLDLTDLGFQPGGIEPWHFRPVGLPITETIPPDLLIEEVVDPQGLAEFTRVSLEGFEVPESLKLDPFDIHSKISLNDPNLHYFLGRVDGRGVSVSMAYVSDGAVGVYGVSTVPELRRRGYGEALTRAAIMANSASPTVLQPSEMAESLYRSMGFSEIGRFRRWHYQGRLLS